MLNQTTQDILSRCWQSNHIFNTFPVSCFDFLLKEELTSKKDVMEILGHAIHYDIDHQKWKLFTQAGDKKPLRKTGP